MDYPAALAYLDSLVNYEKVRSFRYPEALNLGRMRALAAAWEDPQTAYACVSIAGSKGKGSTAAILSAILNAAGIRTGLYTSPHLLDARERIRTCGRDIPERDFAERASRMKELLLTGPWEKDPPTYFEALTVMAFDYFRSQGARVAVLEVGLGGLYDSTSIADAKAAAITPISLEHTDKLGRTIGQIAVQKAGIIKEGQTVISAPQLPEAGGVIERAAAAARATLWRVGEVIAVVERAFGEDFQDFDVRAPLGDCEGLRLKLLGRHQMENAAQAVALAQALGEKAGLKIPQEAMRRGLESARWPGRLEVIGASPRVVLDGAHNADSARRILGALARHFRFERLIAVLGVSEDKDLGGILGQIAPVAQAVVATQSSHVRALPAEAVAKAAGGIAPEVFLEKDALRAFEKARSLAGRNDLVLVTGSLFLVGDIRRTLC
ncbi:MAG: bifunctional folylpolyglutamate synthase/dihydrofolate synthase [Candidatus Omnitrophica bacterium]|nr:bifunctional folylpolyglutamate synthase/dihydrofolate synthase [Candidatus Omnitrophota bacterium]